MDTCLDPMSYLQDTLRKDLDSFVTNSCETFSGLRVKRKPNKDGDVHIPAFDRHMNGDKVDLSSIADKIASSSTLGQYIKTINLSNNGQLNLCLDRVTITKSVICNVISKGIEYGKSSNNSCNSSYILTGYVNCDDSQELSSLDCLRIIITIGHVKNLLCANGPSTEIIPWVLPKDEPKSPLHDLALFNDEIITKTELNSEYDVIVKQMEKAFQENQFVTRSAAKKSSSETNDHQISEHHMCFDCQMYSEDRNFGQVEITHSLLHKLSLFELAARHIKEQSCQILHFTSQRKLHSSQQYGLIWEALSQKPITQAYLSLGNVTTHGNQRAENLKDLLRIRENQLRSAYLLKYGDIVCGPGWDDSIKSVAVSTLKLQIMAASQNTQVKIDVSDTSQDFRQATFIMYNCARLAKLFQHYEESVQQGQFPPLPEIDKIDFSLLREKDEWKLLLCYVLQYPSVVRDALRDLLSTHYSIVTVNTNKITCFLLDLSKDFSSYYGRTHVLGEPRPHLFPCMFARLYLLKAIQQVFHNCLSLMDIQPLTQM